MPAPQPRMHGLTHVPGGSDPIPGLVVRGGGSYADVILAEPSLVAYWPLNEASGDALDISGNSHHLLAANFVGPPTQGVAGPFPADPSQTSYSFNADWLRSTDTALDGYGGTGLTFEAWIYPTAWTDGHIVQCVSGSTAAFSMSLRQFDHDVVWDAATSGLLGITTIALNTWVHLVGTCSATDGIRLYYNGVQVASAAGSAPVNLTSLDFRIGSESTAGIYHYTGRIAQVALYKEALSAATIAAHHTAADDVGGAGITWRHGAGAPASTVDSDYYLDTSTGDVWFRGGMGFVKIWDEP